MAHQIQLITVKMKEQNKTKQNKTKQNKTKQNKTKQNKTKTKHTNKNNGCKFDYRDGHIF